MCAYIAFAGNALKIEQDVSLNPGDVFHIGDYSITYSGITQASEPDKVVFMAKMSAARGGDALYELRPGKAVFHASPNMPTSEIDIKTTPLEDLYVALVSYDPQTETAAFKIFIAPFTWWFWLGGTILLLGTLICLWPTRASLDALRLASGPPPLVRAGAFGVLVALCMMPIAIWTIESHSSWGSSARWEAPRADASGVERSTLQKRWP